MARLVIGVDVVGGPQVEKLANSIDKAGRSLATWHKETEKSSTGTSNIVRAVSLLDGRFKQLGSTATEARAKVEAFLNGGQSRGVAQNTALARSVDMLQNSYESYINTLAKESLMGSKAAQGLASQTAAINANIAAYQKLAAAGMAAGSYNRGTDYVGRTKQLNDHAVAMGNLTKKYEKFQNYFSGGRSALGTGAMAAEINAETRSMEAQTRGLAQLQAQWDKRDASRSLLKEGSIAAEIAMLFPPMEGFVLRYSFYYLLI